jgi:hypothetical protein
VSGRAAACVPPHPPGTEGGQIWRKLARSAVTLLSALRTVAIRGDRPVPRCPSALAPDVGRELCERLRRLEVGIGYPSAGNGADILFHEGLHRSWAQSHFGCRTIASERAAEVITVPSSEWFAASPPTSSRFCCSTARPRSVPKSWIMDFVCFAVWGGRLGMDQEALPPPWSTGARPAVTLR